jgi:hypothetical protein
MTVNVEPNLDKPVPDVARPQTVDDIDDEIRVKANTAMMLSELDGGSSFDMTADDNEQAKKLFEQMGKKKTQDQASTIRKELSKTAVALRLGGYISDYDKQVIEDKIQVRNLVTNRLLEISEHEDPKYSLKALELLGKASDLFTERAELTITHKTSDELKDALRARIEKLMQLEDKNTVPHSENLVRELDVTDVTPIEDANRTE